MNEQQFELHMKALERVRCGIIDVETAVQEIKAELPSQSHNSDYAAALRVWKEFCSPASSMSYGEFGAYCDRRLNATEKE